MKYAFRFDVKPITQQYESGTIRNAPLQSMKNTGNSYYKGSHYMLLPAKMNGIQRRTLVSLWRMYNAVCERHFSGWSDIEQWKNQVHSVSHSLLSYACSQSVSQSVSYLLQLNNCFLKFCSNLLKVFLVACLSLVLPNQYCSIIAWENWCYNFKVMLFCGPCLLQSLLHSTIVLYAFYSTDTYKLKFHGWFSI